MKKLTKPQQRELLRIANADRFSYEAGFFNTLPERNLVKYGLAEDFIRSEPLGGDGAIGKAMVKWNYVRLTEAGKREALLLLYPELKDKNFVVDKCSCGWIYPLFPSDKENGRAKLRAGWFNGIPCRNKTGSGRCTSKTIYGKYNRRTKRWE